MIKLVKETINLIFYEVKELDGLDKTIKHLPQSATTKTIIPNIGILWCISLEPEPDITPKPVSA